MKQINSFILSAILLLCASCGWKQTGTTTTTEPDGNAIVLLSQGSFAIGGTVIIQPGTYNTQQPSKADGQTLHGDHAYVSYQIPDSARRFPMVFLHGAGQSAKTWESTPDRREGFSTIHCLSSFRNNKLNKIGGNNHEEVYSISFCCMYDGQRVFRTAKHRC